jgi:16S rRNA (cytosine1402-N4)-methyltransferase
VSRAKHQKIHPATKTFQALRIAVNNEPGELNKLLDAAPGLLAANGRFIAVSFHSGEDRLVKQSFRNEAREGIYELLTKSVVRPSSLEVDDNPPSRSAKLRAVRRTDREVAHGEDEREARKSVTQWSS